MAQYTTLALFSELKTLTGAELEQGRWTDTQMKETKLGKTASTCVFNLTFL